MNSFISKVLSTFYWIGKWVFWAVSAIIVAIVSVLQYMGLWEMSVLCGLISFFFFMLLDLLSKQTKYIKAFGSLKEARRKGAWRTNINRKMNMIKSIEYLVVYSASSCFFFLTNMVWEIQFNVGVVNINVTTLYTIIFILLCFNELNSIFNENLIGDFTTEEKKRWVNPNVEYNVEILNDDPTKWKVIYLITTSFIVTFKESLVSVIANLKNLLKGGK